MKLSSSSYVHRLLGFVALFTCLWPVALGQTIHDKTKNNLKKYVRGVKTYIRNEQGKTVRESPPNLNNFEWSNEIESQSIALNEALRKQADGDENLLCAWGLNALGGTLTYTTNTNIAFPSLDSNYWITAIRVQDLANSTIKLTGRVPSARYFSFQTYVLEDKFSSTIGALKDVDIVLDDGDETYSILVNDGKDPGDTTPINSLRGLPPGVNDGIIVLMYRTYEPKPFRSPAGGVHLPLISIKRFGKNLRELEYCDDPEPLIRVEDPIEYKTIVQFPQLPANPIWFRTVGHMTPFPNEDVAYLATEDGIFPVMGYVVVVRGKAPTFANRFEENPQVRYWSLCKLSVPSTKTVGCLQDEEVSLDSEGRYVIVVANERPSGVGFDYLNFGPGPLGSMAFRHMLPSDEFFPKSVMNIQNGDDESTIREKMGEYFPETVYCKKSTIERHGVEACF